MSEEFRATKQNEFVEERYLKHDFQERFTHWTHTLDALILVLSGLQIRYPSFAIFGSMSTARFIHLLAGYYFILIGLVHVYFFFAAGKWKIAMPHFSDFKDLIPTIKYYLFLVPEKPDYAKYNILQKTAYALLFFVSFIQAVLGFALYWPGYFDWLIYGLGGFMAVKGWHLLITWAFIAFTAFHVYLVLSEDRRLIPALINGYYFRKVPGEDS